MSERIASPVRIGLGMLAVSALVIGIWAGLAPRAFYDDFPGLGRVWVAIDGPYNEHLVRDVGWLNLALAAATVWAAITLSRPLAIGVLVAWLATSVPHLLYHSANLDGLSPGDRLGELTSLALVPLMAAALLVIVVRDRPTEAPVPGA